MIDRSVLTDLKPYEINPTDDESTIGLGCVRRGNIALIIPRVLYTPSMIEYDANWPERSILMNALVATDDERIKRLKPDEDFAKTAHHFFTQALSNVTITEIGLRTLIRHWRNLAFGVVIEREDVLHRAVEQYLEINSVRLRLTETIQNNPDILATFVNAGSLTEPRMIGEWYLKNGRPLTHFWGLARDAK